MFNEDNGFRDMFIYGSMAMLAALAMPGKKAHAAEFYLCGDGRMLELTNSNREEATKQDPCVTSWYSERQKAVSKKIGKPVAVASAGSNAVSRSTGYQIQTSGIESLTNAVEVPEDKSIIHRPATIKAIRKHETVAERKRARKRNLNLQIAYISKPSKALRYMGDGIFAQ